MGNQTSSQNVIAQANHPPMNLFKSISNSSNILLKENFSVINTDKTEGLSSDSLQGEKCISTNATNESCTTIESKLEDTKIPTLFQWKEGGKVVYLSGSFCNWNQKFLMTKVNNYFEVTLDLPRGVHQFKFIVDEYWRFSRQHPTCSDMKGNINNIIDNSNSLSKKVPDNTASNSAANSGGDLKSRRKRIKVEVSSQLAVSSNTSSQLSRNEYNCNLNVIKDIQYEAVPCPQDYKDSYSVNITGELQSSSGSMYIAPKVALVGENNSYLSISVVPHIHLNHLCITNNFDNLNNNERIHDVILTSLTQRVRNKLVTFAYYSPTQKGKD